MDRNNRRRIRDCSYCRLLVIPMFIDVQSYKPEIEKEVTKATGRPFKIGGDLRLSLFPWAGLAFSDLHLGNPPVIKKRISFQ